MSLTVKAYLHSDWLSEPIETRRFTIDQDVATSYTYLTEKLAQIFSNVNNRQAQNISISYLGMSQVAAWLACHEYIIIVIAA